MRSVKHLLSALILGAILFVGVIHPVREVDTWTSGDVDYGETACLQKGQSVTQYFKAFDNNLIMLEFALSFDEYIPREGNFLFEFVDPDEEVLYSEVYDYAEFPHYTYTGPIMNLPLKKGSRYGYRITNLNIEDNLPRAIYIAEEKEVTLPRARYVLEGVETEGELITRITSNMPVSAENTLALCGCIGLMGFLLYGVLTLVEGKLIHSGRAKTDDEK